MTVRRAGTWDPWLQRLHLDSRLLQQQSTKKLSGTKNNYVHEQLGQITGKIQRDQKAQLLLLKSREQKQGTSGYTTEGVGKPPKPPLWPDPWTHLQGCVLAPM